MLCPFGLGFAPNDVAAPKVRCISSEAGPLEPGALGTSFSTVSVTNSEQLRSAVGLDSKVDASYLVFSGGSQFNLKHESQFEAQSSTVVVTAQTEFGRIALKPPIALTAEAKQLLAEPQKFARTLWNSFRSY